MRSLIFLAIAALSVAACSYHSETVERQTPSGQAVVAERASVGTPTVVIHDHD
jgi:hypothetical protein